MRSRYSALKLSFSVLAAVAVLGATSAASPAKDSTGGAPAATNACRLVTKVVKGKKVKVRVCPKAAKTKCKFVTKRVRGKKKRVRVCAKGAKTTRKAPSPQPRADVLAAQLAARISAASSPEVREQALLATMDALHLGVYRGNGTPVVRGAERSPDDFYLYDFEVSILATLLAGPEKSSLSSLAADLAEIGIRRNGRSLEALELHQILVDGARAGAKTPAKRGSLVPLLVRELGLRQQPAYDLVANPSADRLRFDGLQSFLVIADAILSIDRAARSVAGAGALDSASGSFDCNSISGDPKQQPLVGNGFPWSQQRLLQAISIEVPDFAAARDRLHQRLFKGLLKLEDLTASSQETHYGHETPGKDLRFAVRLVMTKSIPKRTGLFGIECGPFAGLNVPPQGPVGGARVSWSSKLTSTSGRITTLPDHASASSASGATDGSGEGRFDFSPKTEKTPGFGEVKRAVGELTADVEWDLSPKGEGPRVSFRQTWPVSVAYHKPRGFKFSPVAFSFEIVNDNCTFHLEGPCKFTDTISGRICGDDPYAAPWEIHSTRAANYPEDPIVQAGGIDYTMTLDQPISVQDHYRALEWVGPTAQADYRIKFTYVAGLGWQPTSPTSVTVALAEDTSCPEND